MTMLPEDISTVAFINEIELYFERAFCAKSAKVLLGEEKNYEIEVVVRLRAGDDRGVFTWPMSYQNEGYVST